jgi:hypothetical protein
MRIPNTPAHDRKTVLAAALAHDPDIRYEFPDGVVWLAVGQQPDLKELLGRLLRVLTGKSPDDAIAIELVDAVREALDGSKLLLILDDVWQLEHAVLFRGDSGRLSAARDYA